jgi:lipopolysaccharide export system permease protein
VLQGIWLFIADLAGKDLNFFIIFKFLAFYSPKILPLVLPLSVLLASIMTFGSFAENYEFAAMKSSGISLKRAMMGLTVFIVILSFIAFFFANNIIPKAEYKFITLRSSIVQQKPSMVIAEGQFSDVGNGYNIKVNKKFGEEGTLLEGVTIHKKAINGTGLSVVIKAKTGEIVGSEKSSFLQLILYDGNYYEDVVPKKFEERKKLPFAKSEFKKYVINFDLAPLNKQPGDNVVISTNNMLTINELKYTLDSLDQNKKKDLVSFKENTHNRYSFYTKKDTLVEHNVEQSILKIDSLFTNDIYFKRQVLEIAKSNISNIRYTLESNQFDFKQKNKNINEHWLALYDKFVIAYACLLMFFIGAPLGAIIRKGGLGLPIVFAITIFITFHFINVFGKKLAQESGITPFLGAWMSSIILTPFAVLLTHRATNDVGLFDINNILQPFINFFKKIFKTKKTS